MKGQGKISAKYYTQKSHVVKKGMIWNLFTIKAI